jgi:ankyrin repeat protein
MLAEEGLVATYNLLSKFRKVDPIGNIMRFARSPKMPTIEILPVLSDEEIPVIELGDKDAQDNYGNTPLHLAARNGHVEMTKSLLDRGASLEIHNRIGDFTALHVAASKGHKEVVAVLLAKGARLETRFENEQTSGTALTIAAEFGRRDVVKTLLLRANADPQAKTRSGNTALHIAASKGYTEVVKELLSAKKTDVKARTPSGTTALHLAASNGHNDIVMALLNKGADSNERDNTGWTAAHRAAAGGHKHVVMTLLHVDGDIEHQIVLLFMLVDKFPEDHIYPKLLGDTLCKSGNFDDAVEAYNAATGLNPFNKDACRIEDIQHGDVTCFSCQRKVTGIWYHCVSCDQLDMCDDCYNIQSHSEETGHQIMAIPSRQWLQSAGLIDGS